jgi:hypothetical protein
MKERSKLPLLLTELSVMLLIFAVCAAICLSVFAASRRTARESVGELGNAAVRAQSAPKPTRGERQYGRGRRPLVRRIRAGVLVQDFDGNWNVSPTGGKRSIRCV